MWLNTSKAAHRSIKSSDALPVIIVWTRQRPPPVNHVWRPVSQKIKLYTWATNSRDRISGCRSKSETNHSGDGSRETNKHSSPLLFFFFCCCYNKTNDTVTSSSFVYAVAKSELLNRRYSCRSGRIQSWSALCWINFIILQVHRGHSRVLLTLRLLWAKQCKLQTF